MLVGINLLREGIDVPEVSLVAILDADKEGFLRNERSLIQTIGRAARNEKGHVIMYADTITDSMQAAMDETARRRAIQMQYNAEHGIVPKTVKKAIRDVITMTTKPKESTKALNDKLDFDELSKPEQREMIARLEEQMKTAAKNLDFEDAAALRDTVMELKAQLD